MTDTADLIRRSVTRDDYADDPRSGVGGLWNIWVGPAGNLTQAPGLPVGWSRPRDAVLSSTPDMDDLWASAVYKVVTKLAARQWEIDDTNDSTQRTRRYQQMLLHFDGKRWVPGFSKVLQDFLLTDNGAFVEVVRASSARGSRIIGLMHLDSFRCTRTGDPDVPILYQDLKGREHEVKDYQLLDFVDQPSPRTALRGTGRCAASRAFRTILKLTAVETYFREKVTGDRNLAIHIVNGLTAGQLDDALVTGDAEKKRRGFVYYKGSLVIPVMQTDAALNLITIPLASIPDGFDVVEERRAGKLVYANALGVPLQDIEPLSGQGLGTGTQTVILAEEAEAMGAAAFMTDWLHAQNEYVLPETTTFSWSNTHDLRDQEAIAKVKLQRAQERAARIQSGEISPAMARQLAADDGDLPREMLEQDQTPAGDLSDDEKPIDQSVPSIAALFPAPTTPPGQEAAPPPPRAIVKEAGDDWEEAIKWAEEISDE